ncbi:MAG TPA: hypothetical protein VH186_29110 [Chloroflexia bacterium]|nr:hypothetical protein [Chloroflexia bacterium]
MQALNVVSQQELSWEKPQIQHRNYFLRSGESVLASLKWEKAFSTLALAESAAGAWTFKRSGFLKQIITVRIAPTEQEIGRFEANWNGSGVLRMYDSATYRWGKNRERRGYWSFFDALDRPVFSLRARDFAGKTKANVVLEPGAVNQNNLPLLLSLGWYLSLMRQNDEVATTTAITAGI